MNPELSEEMRKILLHVDKVSKLSKICLYTLQDNLEQYNHPFTVQVSCPPPWASFFLVVGALTNHWTVGHNTVQPLDSLTQHYPTIGKLDTGRSDHWTVGKSTV